MVWIINALTGLMQAAKNLVWELLVWFKDQWLFLLDDVFAWFSSMVPESVRTLFNSEVLEQLKNIWGITTWAIPVYGIFGILGAVFLGIAVIRVVRWGIACIPFVNL